LRRAPLASLTKESANRVSIELTVQMLATLFDFPFEERRKLKYWSDLATTDTSETMTREEGQAELMGCAAYFKNLWDLRVKEPPKNDLISMLAHGQGGLPAGRQDHPRRGEDRHVVPLG
jgi:cytochrome P450